MCYTEIMITLDMINKTTHTCDFCLYDKPADSFSIVQDSFGTRVFCQSCVGQFLNDERLFLEG